MAGRRRASILALLLPVLWIGAGGAALLAPAARAQTAEVRPDAPATEAAPAEPAPTESAPTETAPTEATATEAAPAETAPAEATATETAPTEAASTEAASTEAASTEAASTEAAPAEAAPAEAPEAAGPPPVPGLVEESVPPEEAPAEAASPEAAPAEGGVAPEAPAPAPEAPPKAPVDWSTVSNPVPADAASVERGRAFYMGEGLCAVCHGDKGDGFGPVRDQFTPAPNAFVDTKWQEGITDGQIMGVLHDGKFGTGMISMVPDFMTEENGWDVINFVRTFSGKTTEAYERARAEEAQRAEELQRKIQGEKP